MKITESTIKLYKLRDIEDCGWADISLDIGDRCGRISIASDWGNWSYFWSACGESFKEFLIGLSNNIYYVADKFDEDRWFDFKKIIEELENEVNLDLKDNIINEYTAKLLLEQLNDLKTKDCDNYNEFFQEYYYYNSLPDWRHSPEAQYDVSPRFKNFWNKAYLPFIEYLKIKN